MRPVHLFAMLALSLSGTSALAELKPGAAVLIDPVTQTARPCTVVGVIGDKAYVIESGDGFAHEFVAPCAMLYNTTK